MERYLRVNLLGPGLRLTKMKRIYWAAVSQRLRNTGLELKVRFLEIEAEITRTLGRYSKLGNDCKRLVSITAKQEKTQ